MVAVERLDSISLEGINAIAELQTRVDRKYIVTPAVAAAFFDELPSQVQVLEIDGLREFGYESIYFDTEGFDLYLATAQRRRLRYKVRSRVYTDSGMTVLEVKTKGPRKATVKQRCDYSLADVARLTDEARLFVDASVGRDGASEGLRPTLTTRYRRTTLVDPESGSRLTFDRGLSCTDWLGVSVALEPMVIESKSAGGASLFDKWLWRHGVRPTRISKFGTGLAALHPELPSNKWHRTLETWFRPQRQDREPV